MGLSSRAWTAAASALRTLPSCTKHSAAGAVPSAHAVVSRRMMHPFATMPAKQSIADAAVDIEDKVVLVRTDLNVPLDENLQIIDDTRIQESLPTIQHLLANKAKVVVCSHLGRPKGKVNSKYSLAPVAKSLSQHFGEDNVTFATDCIGPDVDSHVDKMAPGQLLLLENVRFHAGEEKNDLEFAEKLAKHANIFVNDAFGTAHRAHSSTVGVSNYVGQSFAGVLMKKELTYLGEVIQSPNKPLAAVMGGAKVDTKFPVIENLLNRCCKVLIGGKMIFTFYQAMGHKMGESLVEWENVDLAKQLIHDAKQMGVDLILPTDVLAANAFENPTEVKPVDVDSIPDGWFGLDIGPQSIDLFTDALATCNTIVWNGPMGKFEDPAFAEGTYAIARAMAERDSATTVVGGGESVAAIKKAGLHHKMSHVSTGGGASLEMLKGLALPGVAVLKDAE